MGANDKMENEEILKALLIADDFEDVFSPFLHHGCSALLPVAERKVLDCALEFLSQAGIQETILFCSSKADVIKEYIKTSRWNNRSSMSVIVMVSERCMSIGDCLRDIDNKGIIKSDFVLLSTASICNIPLQNVLKYHKMQTKKDRGNAMTLILKDEGFSEKNEETIVGFNSVTNRLLLYSKHPVDSKVCMTLEDINEHPQITLSSTLKDIGVAICSSSVPLLFSDNFDFQTKEDFIRGLLLNEEVLASRIYCHVTNSYGKSIKDWASYQRVTADIIHRWTYPLVADVSTGNSDTLLHQRGCIYKHPSVSLAQGCKLDMDVVIGKGAKLGSNVQLFRCVIGKDCVIGNNVNIRDSFLLGNVTVGDDVSVNLSVIGENVRVGTKSSFLNCRIEEGVILKSGTKLDEKRVSSQPSDNGEKIGENAFIINANGSDVESDDGVADLSATWLQDIDRKNVEEWEASSVSDEEKSRPASPEADDCTMFYTEVLDSLQRGFEEKLPCGNLILEVNSSRYAYNVTLSEVTQLTCKAVFALPTRLKHTAKPILQYFKPLFQNYVKTEEGQRECLGAFEEMYESLGNEVNNCLHYLYDSDVLAEEVIESWYEDLDDIISLKTKLSAFMQWLSEAAEESDEE